MINSTSDYVKQNCPKVHEICEKMDVDIGSMFPYDAVKIVASNIGFREINGNEVPSETLEEMEKFLEARDGEHF